MTSLGRRLTVLVLFLMTALLGAAGGALLARLLTFGPFLVLTAALAAVALVLRKRRRGRRAGKKHCDDEFTHDVTFSSSLPCEMRLDQ